MLVSLGRTPRREGLVDLLLACHARIRSFASMAERLGDPAPDDGQVVAACDAVARYFGDALPLHARDEEESLLPRLAGRDPALDDALLRMRREHADHVAALRDLLDRCEALRASPGVFARRAELARAARHLRAAFEPHLEREEREVFPAADALLTDDERRAAVAEMRARRAG
ncbi:MAG: hemerythrin domain-containing protein [Polyangiales bacterium]